MTTPKLNTVDGIRLCDACLDGEGDMCDTPGCVMIRRRCPDLPLREDIILGEGTIAPDGSDELTARAIVERLLALDFTGDAVICTTCERRKNPRGRDSGIYASSGLCHRDECDGYDEEPRPTSLHPGERASEFGYVHLGWEGSRALWALIRDVRAAEEARKDRAQEAFDAIPCDEEAAP